MNHEIAIVGPKETVLGFKAIGFKTYDSVTSEETLETLKKLKKETLEGSETPRFAIIFILESHAQRIPLDEYKKLTAGALPAIIALPGPGGSTGFGNKRISQIVEQAIGSNIFKQ